MVQTSSRWLFLIVAALASGCPEIDENFLFSLKVVQPPALKKKPVCGDVVTSAEDLNENEYTLRLTFLQRARQAAPNQGKEQEITPGTLRDFELICQRIIPPKQDVELVVPVGQRLPGDPISVLVEAFKKGKLYYVGRRDDLRLTGGDGSVYLRRTIEVDSTGFSCMQNTRGYRAFHSATLLPNGQVLIFGGLVAGQGGIYSLDTTGELAYATGGVEVYDPATLKFLLPSGTIEPRAFHEAQLLPSPPGGPYEILLVGGVQPPASNQPAFRIRERTPHIPFLISPHEKTTAAPYAILTYTPASGQQAMKVEYRALVTPPDAVVMFPTTALTVPPTSLVVAGGAAATLNLYVNTDLTRGFTGGKSAVWIELKGKAARLGQDPAILTTASMINTRVGHAMARLGSGRFVVIGGNMDGNATDVVELYTSGTSSAFALAAVTPTPASSIWHTLTPIGSSDKEINGKLPILPTVALWAGGYALAEEATKLRLADTTKQAKALQLVRDTTTAITVADVLTIGSSDFKSTGYHDALRLYDGSVLLSGGNLNTCVPSSPFCGSTQLASYSLASGMVVLRPGLPELRVGRFGHRATRLLDNTILITGGVTVVVKKKLVNGKEVDYPEPQLTNVAERFNPRTGHATEDYPLGRSAPQDGAPDPNPPIDTTCKERREVEN